MKEVRTLYVDAGEAGEDGVRLDRWFKRRWPHLDVWLTHTDGRASTLAEAMRLGADALLADDGQLHRTAPTTQPDLTPLRAVPMDEGRTSTVSPPTSK